MEDDRTRRRSPSQTRVNKMNSQPSANALRNLSAEFLGRNPNYATAQYNHGSAGSTFQYDTAYSNSTTPHQSLPQSNGTDSLLFPNDQFQMTSFQQDQQVDFHDPQIFSGQYIQRDNTMGFANTGGNIQESFADNNFPLVPSFEAPPQQPNVNPASLSKVPSSHASTPPHLFSPESHHSPAQPGSPASTQGQFYTPQHSRHQSLDPASAAYPQGPPPTEWQGMSFQQHTRELSDHSDISSNSASPYLQQVDIQDSTENYPSPLLSAQQDGINAFGIENVTIHDQTQAQLSPGHSPYISPQLPPQQTPSPVIASDYMNHQGVLNHLSGPGPEIYTTSPDATLGEAGSNDVRNMPLGSEMGRADQYPAPTINIEPAPVSRQTSFEGERRNLGENLSPPARARGRSKSDPHVSRPASRQLSRSTSPGHHPQLLSFDSLPDDRSIRSLSPGPGPLSRESSPGASSGRIEKSGRRQSTSSIPAREYFLGLADPNRPNASPSHSSTRGQKHPATFQCTLCPKRFTRAYNLRSHLRTHTDERPFVCTVCGKAFARQHDRKRHEGLHSGEKKFVCKGELGSGGSWGCGRKFARADALGRHFRSEAGRICIRPLLDEEAAERARNHALVEQQQHRQHQHHQQSHARTGSLQPVQQPMMINMDASSPGAFALPAALLAQYPALSNIDWASIPQGDDTGDLSDVGMGGNSFDASSGGEMDYDENDMNKNYVNNNGLNYPDSTQVGWGLGALER